MRLDCAGRRLVDAQRCRSESKTQRINAIVSFERMAAHLQPARDGPLHHACASAAACWQRPVPAKLPGGATGGEGEGRARHADGLVDIDSANDTYRPCTAQGKGMATRGERESTTTMWQSRDERRRPAAANAVS